MTFVQRIVSCFGAEVQGTCIVVGLLYIEGCSGDRRSARRMAFLHRSLGSCKRSGGVCIPIKACKEPTLGTAHFSHASTAAAAIQKWARQVLIVL